MLLYKKNILPRLADITSYYANKDILKAYHTAITRVGPLDTLPWGFQGKAPLTLDSVKNKLSTKDIDIVTKLLVSRVKSLADSGGGSFGPYNVLPTTQPNGLVTIRKKPKAKTRKQAIQRIKELTFLVYGLTLQDEIEAGQYTRDVVGYNSEVYYTTIRSWGCDLPESNPGISLLRWGTTITMRLGKTLAVILGLILNPYSDYFDIKQNMHKVGFMKGSETREDYRKLVMEKPEDGMFWVNRRIINQNGDCFWLGKSVFRTNLKTGVPDKITVGPSYWFDCFDGPDLPEFHFFLEYANTFTLQYSPKEKNKWILYMQS